MKHFEEAALFARDNGFELRLVPDGLYVSRGRMGYLITYLELEHAIPNVPLLVMKCLMQTEQAK